MVICRSRTYCNMWENVHVCSPLVFPWSRFSSGYKKNRRITGALRRRIAPVHPRPPPRSASDAAGNRPYQYRARRAGPLCRTVTACSQDTGYKGPVAAPGTRRDYATAGFARLAWVQSRQIGVGMVHRAIDEGDAHPPALA